MAAILEKCIYIIESIDYGIYIVTIEFLDLKNISFDTNSVQIHDIIIKICLFQDTLVATAAILENHVEHEMKSLNPSTRMTFTLCCIFDTEFQMG